MTRITQMGIRDFVERASSRLFHSPFLAVIFEKPTVEDHDFAARQGNPIVTALLGIRSSDWFGARPELRTANARECTRMELVASHCRGLHLIKLRAPGCVLIVCGLFAFIRVHSRLLPVRLIKAKLALSIPTSWRLLPDAFLASQIAAVTEVIVITNYPSARNGKSPAPRHPWSHQS
jgi:hypothetical protein